MSTGSIRKGKSKIWKKGCSKMVVTKSERTVRPRSHKRPIRWKLQPSALVKGVTLIVEGERVAGANAEFATLYNEHGREVSVPLAALCSMVSGGLEAGLGFRELRRTRRKKSG